MSSGGEPTWWGNSLVPAGPTQEARTTLSPGAVPDAGPSLGHPHLKPPSLRQFPMVQSGQSEGSDRTVRAPPQAGSGGGVLLCLGLTPEPPLRDSLVCHLHPKLSLIREELSSGHRGSVGEPEAPSPSPPPGWTQNHCHLLLHPAFPPGVPPPQTTWQEEGQVQVLGHE